MRKLHIINGLVLVLGGCNLRSNVPKKNHCCFSFKLIINRLFSSHGKGDKEKLKRAGEILPKYNKSTPSSHVRTKSLSLEKRKELSINYINKNMDDRMLKQEVRIDRTLFKSVLKRESNLDHMIQKQENDLNKRFSQLYTIYKNNDRIENNKEADKNMQIEKLDNIYKPNDTKEIRDFIHKQLIPNQLNKLADKMQKVNDDLTEIAGTTQGGPNMEARKILFDQIKNEYMQRKGILYEKDTNEN